MIQIEAPRRLFQFGSLALLCLASTTTSTVALSLQQQLDRRHFVVSAAAAAVNAQATLGLSSSSSSAALAMEPNGLASRLIQRDPNQLRNKVFNVPPAAQIFPPWMRGTWQVESKFSGYLFPSKKISRDRLTQDFVIPGFQKCSIAQTADVGKDQVNYLFKVDEQTGLEDRRHNFKSAIDAYLGYPAVNQVIYDARKNPNRISIDFNDYRTVNAERIELFCNAREFEEYQGSDDGTPIFVHSEYAKQVTFGTGSTYGVPRQVGTNYGLFWTYRRISENELTGNLLTAAYLDPQDALYFEEPVAPVVVYSNVFQAKRQTT